MRAQLAIILALFAATATTARADEMVEWCAQVKKASSIVICSDTELRAGAIARNKLFEVARSKFRPEDYKTLTDDQSRWIKTYTARCGISLDDPPPPLPIQQSVIDCYRRESRARTAYLASRLSEPNVVPPPIAATGPETASRTAMEAWYRCLYETADNLAAQPEPARTVADAAFGACTRYEVDYREALGKNIDWNVLQRAKSEVMVSKILARVMATRNARQQAAKPPSLSSKASDEDLEKWVKCTVSAVDALFDQPEPAQAIVNAVFGSCLTEQLTYQKSAGLSDRQIEEDKAVILGPRVLAQVMAVRAARAKLQKEGPDTKPAIDYRRM